MKSMNRNNDQRKNLNKHSNTRSQSKLFEQMNISIVSS